jgi:hypothetical protein
MMTKIIVTLATAAVLLILDVTGMLQGSVGGSMTVFMVLMIAALVVGIVDAWSMRRGVLGWIVSILVALVGAIIGGLASGMVMDTVLSLIRFEGRPGQIFGIVGVIITLTGSWLALGLVNRFR